MAVVLHNKPMTLQDVYGRQKLASVTPEVEVNIVKGYTITALFVMLFDEAKNTIASTA